MKVAHLTTVDVSLRYLLLAQLKALRDQGHEVIGISAPGPWVADLEREGIRHVALASSTRSTDIVADMRSARELWRVLRRERPDVLHTHNPKPGFYGRVVGRMAGVPIIVNTVHGLYATEDDAPAKRFAVYTLEAVAARFSDAELIQNPEDLELMRRTRMTRRATLLGNGVDLRRFDPDRFGERDREAVRASLGAAREQLVIGTVGRLVAEKGYPELFDAVRELEPDRYLLVVIGDEDPAKPDALSDEALRAAPADGVRFLGHRDDIDALYAAMDVFVLASHREGYPRAAMEAAAMGLPVIATDIRGCRQVVEPGHSGVLVPRGRAPAIAGAIRTLGENPSLRAEMGSTGRALARRRFDERNVSRTVMDTYREVAQRKGTLEHRVDVLQVITSDDRRGAELEAVDINMALWARGYRVRAVALAPGTHGGGLDVPTLGPRPLAIETLWRLRREASAAAVVVAHGSKALPASACALTGTGIPLVYRSIGDPEQWANTRARRARVRVYLRRVNGVVALTSEAAASLEVMYGWPRSRIAVIPTSVSRHNHPPIDDATRREARRHFAIPDDADVATLVGALSPEKNVGLAIDAVAEVPSLHLVVAGDGPERAALEERAARRAPGRVHFAGSLRDPGPAFASADVVVLTSRTEGLPGVLIEAGLRELPVVATDVGYVRDIVVDGKTGWLVPPGSTSDLTAAISRALGDGSQVRKTARSHCMARFEVERLAERWDLLLTGVRAQPRGTAVPPTLTAPR